MIHIKGIVDNIIMSVNYQQLSMFFLIIQTKKTRIFILKCNLSIEMISFFFQKMLIR